MRRREEDRVEIERLRGVGGERLDLERADRGTLEPREEIGRGGRALLGLPRGSEETDDRRAGVRVEDREQFGAGVAARADDGAADGMGGGVGRVQRRLRMSRAVASGRACWSAGAGGLKRRRR
jgi:hypothetical protein